MTRLAPSALLATASKQVASITNLFTSSYNQLSHTPSVASTKHNVLLAISLLSLVVSLSVQEVVVGGGSSSSCVSSILLKIMSRSSFCISGRWVTPGVYKDDDDDDYDYDDDAYDDNEGIMKMMRVNVVVDAP